MARKFISLLLLGALCSCQTPRGSTSAGSALPVGRAAAVASRPQTPIMGWSSWNNFHAAINEQIIKGQADAMVSSGMQAAGYRYVNVDDGFFGGRDKQGNLMAHPTRFPGGMRAVSDYIHSKGLKAGIYSDAGINTCASYWDKDTVGVGMGLHGHEAQDLKRLLQDWNYDFIKVDWCGGKYAPTRCTTSAAGSFRASGPCRWPTPGASPATLPTTSPP
jgi:alpha-galactosidase